MRVNSCKKTLATIFLLSLTLSSFNTLAADTTKLTINGRFIPTSCDISLSQMTIDVGDIKYGELIKKRSGFGKKDFIKDVGVLDKTFPITVTVNCDSLASAGFKITDDLKSHAPWNLFGTDAKSTDLSNTFALVSTSGLSDTQTIGGYYFAYIKETSTAINGDNKKIKNVAAKGPNASEFKWRQKLTAGGSEEAMFWGTDNTNDPIKAKSFTQKISPKLYFYYDSNQQAATDTIEFTGKSTLTLFYI